MMEYSWKQKLIYIGPVVIFLLTFSVFPLIYSLKISFTDLNLARANTGNFVGFDNFITLFKPDSLFLKALANTSILSIGTLIAELLAGFIMAKLFYVIKGKPFFALLRTVYMLPIMVTPMVFGLIWVHVLNPTQGIVNFFLGIFSIPPGTWMGNPKTALLTIMLIDWWQFTPFVTIILLAGLFTIDNDMYDAANIDGANVYQVILYVELPNISQLIGIAAILRIIDILKMFDLVYVTTRGGPGGATEVISLYSYRQAFEYYNIGMGVASAIVTLIFIVTFSTLFKKYTDIAE